MKKNLFIFLGLFLAISIMATEIDDNISLSNNLTNGSSADNLGNNSKILLSIGVSPLIAQTILAKIGYGYKNEKYFVGYKKSLGLINAQEFQFRIAHYKDISRTKSYLGLVLGYTEYDEIEIFYSEKPLKENKTIELAFVLGYTINRYFDCSIDIGNIPGIISINFNFNLF